MAVGDVWVLHGIETPNNFYSVFEDATPAPTNDALIQFASGHPQPLFTALRGQKPEIVFTTHMVGTAIGEFGLLGADLSGGNTDLYYAKVTDKGTRVADATTSHIRLRCANAFAYIRSIRQQHQQESTAEIRVALPYDGTNDPIVPAGSKALSGTSDASEFYTLGPTSLNAADLSGVQSSDLQLNPEVMELGDDGEIWPTFVAIRSVQPVLQLTGLDVDWWNDYGLSGTAMTGLTHYGRAKSNEGGNVADGTTSHFKVVGVDGQILVERSTNAGNQEANAVLTCNMRATNASGDAVTLSDGVAIT